MTKRALSIGLLLGACACSGTSTPLTYTALEIVPGVGDTGTLATGINALGELSGIRETAAGSEGFLVIGNTIVAVPPIFGDAFSTTAGIDALGDSAGTSSTAPSALLPSTRPFLFRAGTSSPIALPPGDTQGVGTAISPTGAVAGLSTNPPLSHLFVTTSGTAVTIPFFPTDNTGSATGINANGLVVGYSSLNSGTKHGFFFSPEANSVGLIGAVPGDFDSLPTAINASGLVVGYSIDTLGDFHSYVFDTSALVLTPIAAPTNDAHYRPASINASGHIVGGRPNAIGAATGQPHAYLLESPSSGAFDLNSLLPAELTQEWTFYDAVGINDSGQIAANAIRADGTIHAFRISPANLASGGQLFIGGDNADGGTTDGGS